MKNIFKKNQIIITALAIMIVIAGYLTFSGKDITDNKQDDVSTADLGLSDYDLQAELEKEMKNASAEAVDENEIEDGLAAEGNEILDISEEDIENSELAEINVTDTGELVVDTSTEAENPGEAVLASSVINANFFSSSKLKREQTRAKNKETINEIINNTSLSDTLKQDAVNRLIEITNIAEMEDATELMLEARGFDDAVVSILDDRADVVINAATLSDQQLAQIEDIVKKKTQLSLLNIEIYPVVAQD